jgi:mycothiol synthase
VAEKAEVRPYKNKDAPELTRIHNEIYRDEVIFSNRFRRRLASLQKSGGRIWTILVDGKPVGYASVQPVPGLEGIFDLQGYIDPKYQRNGLGGHLLNHLLADLEGSPTRQVSHPVNDIGEPAALFLKQHGFFIEHVEIFLTLDMDRRLPANELPAGYTLKNYSRPTAISHFRDLYDKVFSDYPWYQPYESDSQVSAELADSTDILFLLHHRQPIGFLWIRWLGLDRAEIEPLGILPAYQRQGLGRSLFLAALEEMAKGGARHVSVGVWQDNEAAIRFYEGLGFIPDQTVTYLAYNLNQR